jgi:hypothetical protein
MESAAIAVAILGVSIGATFRLRFLLGVVVLVLAITLFFALSHSYTFLSGLLIVVVAQTLLQGGYFAGLVGRAFFSRVQRKFAGLSGPKADRLRQPDS